MKRCLGMVALLVGMAATAFGQAAAQYVITISVDGMGSSYMQALVEQGKLPNMQRLRDAGASTMNARTDYDYTNTLPNHTCMVTGRRVKGAEGHNWTDNGDPKPGQTLHTRKGSHVASAFEVAHDSRLRTGMWATKSKFSLYHASCQVEAGAATQVNKMDLFCRLEGAELVTANFIDEMKANPLHYAFIHFGDPDGAGHAQGWGSDAYNAALARVDGCIGRILDLVDSTEALRGKTAVIVTADHGGEGKDHSDAKKAINYTIPFWTWGAGVDQGELYAMNPTRQDPGIGRPTYEEEKQPVRNGDAGNLGMRLLGLPAIPGSMIGEALDLRTRKAEPAAPAGNMPAPATRPAREAA